MLAISNLNVSVDNQEIIKNFSLVIESGTIHALMGKNGSGKTTLAYALMGHPRYSITAGSIHLNGHDITHITPDKRAQLGLFLAFQYPPELPGVSVWTFLKEAYQAVKGVSLSATDFQQMLSNAMDVLAIDSSFAQRNLNEGFSGGEKKRFEMLQILILQPKIVLLDELDSGLDIDALKIVAKGLMHIRALHPTMSILMITHYQRFFDYISPDFVHIMHHGILEKTGTIALAHRLEQKGYDEILNG